MIYGYTFLHISLDITEPDSHAQAIPLAPDIPPCLRGAELDFGASFTKNR